MRTTSPTPSPPASSYLPEGLPQSRFYRPAQRGLELRIAERLAELRARDETAGKPGSEAG